jgi:hypothetical protein
VDDEISDSSSTSVRIFCCFGLLLQLYFSQSETFRTQKRNTLEPPSADLGQQIKNIAFVEQQQNASDVSSGKTSEQNEYSYEIPARTRDFEAFTPEEDEQRFSIYLFKIQNPDFGLVF